MTVRDFLYLDQDMVRSFLAQLEGGQVDEERSRETRSTRGEAGVNLGLAGFGAKASGGGSMQRETEMVIRQVAASEFERLYNLLDGEREIHVVERADTSEDVGEARRKAFVEFDGRVKTAGLGPVLEGLAPLISAAKMLQSMPSAAVSIDEEALEGITAVSSLSGNLPHTTITMRIPGNLGFTVAAELKREAALTDNWDLEATALVRVQRVLRIDETFVLGDPTGGLLAATSEADRQKLNDALQSPHAKQFGLDADLQITAPGVVVTPLAIFR